MEPISNESKEGQSYNDLMRILDIILNHLKIIKAEGAGNFEDEIKKLGSLTTDTNEDLDLFTYFLQQLFLDEKKEFDFNIDMLLNIIPEKNIKMIFNELKNGIEDHDFFYFLEKIGTIFVSFYFINDKAREFLNDNITKCKNSYECILFILFSCKREKSKDWFFGIYGGYFQICYEKDILLKLIISMQNHFNLLYGKDLLNEEEKKRLSQI